MNQKGFVAKMISYKGRILCQGTAVAKAVILCEQQKRIVQDCDDNSEISDFDSSEEIKRIDKAVKKSISFLTDSLNGAEKQLFETSNEECESDVKSSSREITEAYICLLSDSAEESLVERIKTCIIDKKENAENAIEQVAAAVSEEFLKSDSEYFRARSEDICGIAGLLTEHLAQEVFRIEALSEPSIIVAKTLSPEKLLSFDCKFIAGIVTEKGSTLSHTAILARGMNVPYMSGVKFEDIKKNLFPNENADYDEQGVKIGKGVSDKNTTGYVIIDGENVIVNPDAETLSRIQEHLKDTKESITSSQFQTEETEASDTSGKGLILLCANIAKPEDVTEELRQKVSGIGLFRTEFLYIGRDVAPNEDEQYEAYVRVLDAMGGKPVRIRTLDMGADKQAKCLGVTKDTKTRGIRFCFERPEIFETQLRALLRAADQRNLEIMFPMIKSEDEVLKAKETINNIAAKLDAEGIKYLVPKIGIMVETKEAVQRIEELVKIVNFVSIGTNDLTESVLKIDRTKESVNYSEAQTEVIFECIEKTVNAAKRAGISVGICGELGADTELTKRFVEMGVDELSMTPTKIPFVATNLREQNV